MLAHGRRKDAMRFCDLSFFIDEDLGARASVAAGIELKEAVRTAWMVSVERARAHPGVSPNEPEDTRVPFGFGADPELKIPDSALDRILAGDPLCLCFLILDFTVGAAVGDGFRARVRFWRLDRFARRPLHHLRGGTERETDDKGECDEDRGGNRDTHASPWIA